MARPILQLEATGLGEGRETKTRDTLMADARHSRPMSTLESTSTGCTKLSPRTRLTKRRRAPVRCRDRYSDTFRQ